MYQIMTKHKLWIGVLALLAAVVLAPSPAHAQATVTIDLCATTGTVSIPGETDPVNIWGYTSGNCTNNTAPAVLPNPQLEVNQGDEVTINLYNNLTEATSLQILGQGLPLDTVGVQPGEGKSYTFTAIQPGTYLYEAGVMTNGRVQSPMGMYGALIVRPLTVNQAYDDTSTAYASEAVLVLSEIDPNLNTSPGDFANLRNFVPKYKLINGKVYPQPQTVPLTATAGDRVLLRYVNAGQEYHSMTALGMNQTVVAEDGNLLPHSYTIAAHSIPPGATLDALVTMPAAAGAQYPIYDGGLVLKSNGGAYTGMLTFLSESTTNPSSGDFTGPATSNVGIMPGVGAVTVTASVSDLDSGGAGIQAAEYFVDTPGDPGTGTPMSGTPAGSPTSVSASINTGNLTAGIHNVYVRGQDDSTNLNWGEFSVASFNLDTEGPATTALTLMPNPSNGAVEVLLSGTADDSASGGNDIMAAEYFVDGSDPGAGSANPMGLNGTSPTVAITGTIPAGLGAGVHTVSVRSQDATGVWGQVVTIDLGVDQTGPTTDGVTLTPNPTNGQIGVNAGQPEARVDATISDLEVSGVRSNVVDAEAFIDTIGADGNGIRLTLLAAAPTPVETAYAFIPLANIQALGEGTHTLYVHGLDAAGNWGPVATTEFIVDITAPVVTSVTVSPSPTNGATSVTLTANASDSSTGVAGAEYFVGTDPGMGNGTQMTSVDNGATWIAADIDVTGWADGNYTLGVRAQDAAGNWSVAVPTTLVVADILFADGFETGNFSAWSINNGSSSVSTNAAMAGTFGMEVNLLGGAEGRAIYNYNVAPALTTYNARFYFNPNGAMSPGQSHRIFDGQQGTTARFWVLFRRNNAGVPQVRAIVSQSAGAVQRTAWYTIADAPQYLEFMWEAGTNASFSLYVNGTLHQLTGLNTSGYEVTRVRLGAIAGVANSYSGIEYFDEFVSKRSLAAPIGP